MQKLKMTKAEAVVFRFLTAADGLDVAIALLLALITGGLLSLWAFPALHPDSWGAAAVASAVRPPETPVAGLWTFLARGVCRVFGQNGGFAALGDSPHDQRLAAVHITRSKDLFHIGLVVPGSGNDRALHLNAEGGADIFRTARKARCAYQKFAVNDFT